MIDVIVLSNLTKDDVGTSKAKGKEKTNVV